MDSIEGGSEESKNIRRSLSSEQHFTKTSLSPQTSLGNSLVQQRLKQFGDKSKSGDRRPFTEFGTSFTIKSPQHLSKNNEIIVSYLEKLSK